MFTPLAPTKERETSSQQLAASTVGLAMRIYTYGATYHFLSTNTVDVIPDDLETPVIVSSDQFHSVCSLLQMLKTQRGSL